MLYVRPDESILFAPSSVPSIDATYDEAWLTDGLPGYPVRQAGGSLSATVTPASAITLDLFAVVNHNIKQAASIAIGGTTSTTIATAAWPADDIPYNWFKRISAPVAVSSITLAVTDNTDPVVVGELYAGLARTFTHWLAPESTFMPEDPYDWEGEHALLAPYDSGVASRRLSGDAIMTGTELAQVLAWHQSTRRGTRATLLVPFDAVNDAWLVVFKVKYQPIKVNPSDAGGSVYRVSFEFVEIPRVRW